MSNGTLHQQARVLQQFNTDSIKIILLENVRQGAVKIIREQGFE